MEPIQFFSLVIPLAIIIIILVTIVYYLGGRTGNNSYENEMRKLRKLWFMGKLDRKSFFYIRDNMKAEKLFENESKLIDNMLTDKKIDQDNYARIKKVLQMTFNKKLLKINERYNSNPNKKINI